MPDKQSENQCIHQCTSSNSTTNSTLHRRFLANVTT